MSIELARHRVQFTSQETTDGVHMSYAVHMKHTFYTMYVHDLQYVWEGCKKHYKMVGKQWELHCAMLFPCS